MQVCRNTQARYLYSILGGVSVLVAGLASTSDQRWPILAGLAGAWFLGLRYLMPTRAELAGEEIRMRWPLRRVTMTAATLRSVQWRPSGVSRQRYAIRVDGAAPFVLVLSQFSDALTLARALAVLLERSPALTPEDRAEVARALVGLRPGG